MVDVSPVIWFAPRDNLDRLPFYTGSPDFLDLFLTGAPWTQAAQHIKVFELYPQFVLGSTDADLQTVITGLQQRNIALAVSFGMLTNPSLCGVIEGYCGEQVGAAMGRIQSFGGTVAYITMDEPLWFGRYVTGRPIADLAQDVANQVATVHNYFPNAVIGDTEPLSGTAQPSDYMTSITQWISAYNAAVGAPLGFFQCDVSWQIDGALAQLPQVLAATRPSGIKFGVIYNDDNASTGVGWTTSAQQNFIELESNQAIVPDQAVIQTFDMQPTNSLPETTPGTMTYLVNQYVAWRRRQGETPEVIPPSPASPGNVVIGASPAASTLDQTIGVATAEFGLLVQSSANDATAIFRVIYGLTDGNDYGRYFAGEDPLIPYIASATSVAAMQTQGATLRAAVAAAITQAQTDAGGNTTVYPIDILAVTEALRAACANPDDALRLLSALVLFSVTTPFDGPSPVSNEAAAIAQTIYFTAGVGHAGQPLVAWPTWFGDPFVLQFAQLTSAAAVLMRRAAAISLARASATYAPTSYQDAQRVLGIVDSGLWEVIEEAGDIFDDVSYNALKALRAAVQTDFRARGANLAQVVTRTFGAQQPALVLAYRLYQDASRADDLIARNDPPHPGFMPVSVEVLAS